jgi:hypothetical protein
MGSADKQSPKKAYEPPQLSVYGKVHELTEAVGPFGQKDNGRRIGRTHTTLR